jgi:hypothetical protein
VVQDIGLKKVNAAGIYEFTVVTNTGLDANRSVIGKRLNIKNFTK